MGSLGGVLKKRYDPLWQIVDEKVALQGSECEAPVECPSCHVSLVLSGDIEGGRRFRCGLCGALCEVEQLPEEPGISVLQVE